MSEQEGDEFPYDVALSFAGEQRTYVDRVARALRRKGLSPFYDRFEEAKLWGKDLYEHLDDVYRKRAKYCVIFVSEAYARKAWPTQERRSAQARALESKGEYVLPVRFDDTEIPGLRPTIAYVKAGSTMPAKLASMIAEKVGPKQRTNYLPARPNKLFAAVEVTSQEDKEAVLEVASSFLQTLRRMNSDERRFVVEIFRGGCPTDLPDNMHMTIDLLRRELGRDPAEIEATLMSIGSLGFECDIGPRVGEHEGEDVVVLKWFDRTAYFTEPERYFASERSTEIAVSMVELAGSGHCYECGMRNIERLDFSFLSSEASGR